MSKENFFVLLISTDDSLTVSFTFLIIAIQRASQYKDIVITSIGIPMLKISRSRDRLIFNMRIPIPGKDVLYIERGPRWRTYLHGSAIQAIHVAMTVATCITTCLSCNGVQYNVSKLTHFGHHCPVKYLANTLMMIHQQLILIFIWMTETIIYQA